MSVQHDIQYDPRPANVSKDDVEELASLICEKMNFKPGDDIVKLVKDFGGEVKYLGMDEWIETLGDPDGAIDVRGPKDFTIFVSRFTGPTRNRFTIAHELGHYVLHSVFGKKPVQVARSGIDKRVEWEANWFAGSLLMPKDKFIEMASQDNSKYFLANHFAVSSKAIEVRKKHFGIEQ